MTTLMSAHLRSACYLAFDDGTNSYSTPQEAADLIEAQQAEIERLTAVNDELLAALEAIVATWDGPKYSHFMGPNIDLARTAIAEAKGGDA